MRKYAFAIIILVVILVIFISKTNNEINNRFNYMILRSSVFANGENIPKKYTCDGVNINPPLTISEVPGEAKSLVLIVDDPDAPMGTWLHWSVWNIDPSTREIPENSIPTGAAEGETDFGTSGYGGPCPPAGAHRYVFRLYALDKILNLESGAKLRELKTATEGHVIDETRLTGIYER